MPIQRNCNLCNLIFLSSEINCQSLECKLNGPQSEVTQQNTNWLEENLIHVEKHSQKSITEHCQDLLCTCNFYKKAAYCYLSFCVFSRHKVKTMFYSRLFYNQQYVAFSIFTAWMASDWPCYMSRFLRHTANSLKCAAFLHNSRLPAWNQNLSFMDSALEYSDN